MEYVVRIAEEADIPACLAIYADYVRDSTVSFEYEAPAVEEFRRRFHSVMEGFPWLVCEVEGKIAGYAYASLKFARAAYQWDADLSIYLSPDFQGRGVGRRLCTAICSLLQAQGYRTLYAVITAENERSLAFHRAMGFAEIGRFPESGYKFGRWLDVVWMECKLAPLAGGRPKPPKKFSELDGGFVESVLQ